MCNCSKVIAPKKNTTPKKIALQKAVARKRIAKTTANKRAIAAKRRPFPPKK